MADRIIVVGSLNPEKEVQDRVRVLSGLGICQAIRATDYKDPPKVLVRNLEPKILENKERKEDIADRD